MATCALTVALAVVLAMPCKAFLLQGSLLQPKRNILSTCQTTTLAHDEPTIAETEENINLKTEDILSLDSIRSTLIRQEETIIFAVIERAQFRRNAIVYEAGGFGDLGVPLGSIVPDQPSNKLFSFLEFMMIGTEVLHCYVRRYTSPEEHPFFPEHIPRTPLEMLPMLKYPNDLLSSKGNAMSINFNPILFTKYIDWIVPYITKPGDDEQHGSSVLSDIAVLQALSRRVHYGKFVAESKYRSDPKKYEELVQAGDAEGVMELLTNTAVEKKVLKRARLKALAYGTEPIPDAFDAEDPSEMMSVVREGDYKKRGKINPAVIEDIYKKFIIPLTKDIEVDYLFRRCGRDPPEEYGPDRMSQDLF